MGIRYFASWDAPASWNSSELCSSSGLSGSFPDRSSPIPAGFKSSPWPRCEPLHRQDISTRSDPSEPKRQPHQTMLTSLCCPSSRAKGFRFLHQPTSCIDTFYCGATLRHQNLVGNLFFVCNRPFSALYPRVRLLIASPR